jgi:Putative heavy-metal-binding
MARNSDPKCNGGQFFLVYKQTVLKDPTGGNAIVAMRFDTSELGSTWTEICAYGTAVVARGL